MVLLPWIGSKLLEQEVLHWDQDIDLIAKVFLERAPAMSQRGPELLNHLRPLLAVIANPEVVPHAKAYCIGVLVRLDTNPAPVLSDVLNRGMTIQVSGEQARQATAIQLDGLEPLPIILSDPGSSTDDELVLLRQ